ncbi:MAG: hypothetical protein H6872_05740 [Methylobacteriaceae bacterium]|nr:hypothetical protein [Methylobacteriaceae bacterium]
MKWRRTVIAGEARPDDGCLVVGTRIVARVYRNTHGPSTGTWQWFWQMYPSASGRADTKEAAKEECERRARQHFGDRLNDPA